MGYVALPVERRVLNMVERSVIVRVYVGVMVSSLLAGLIAIAVGLAISRRLTQPLRALTDAAGQLSTGVRLAPVPITTNDEVGDLARAFNAMALDLAHQQTLRRNLVADIAHELRTPLSVLRLQAEALQDGVAAPTPAIFASLTEEVGLLSHLVDDLRLLSLADAGQLAVSLAHVDAVAVAQRALAIAQPRAQAQQIALHCQVNGRPPAACADPQRLLQVLSGLLDNALRYTPAGGSVTVRIRQEDAMEADALGALFVSVAMIDSGPGIAPTDLPHVFERFYRADPARARETGGSGLGLAIAQRLVVAMGGRIWVESPPGSGACFVVVLSGVVTALTD